MLRPGNWITHLMRTEEEEEDDDEEGSEEVDKEDDVANGEARSAGATEEDPRLCPGRKIRGEQGRAKACRPGKAPRPSRTARPRRGRGRPGLFQRVRGPQFATEPPPAAVHARAAGRRPLYKRGGGERSRPPRCPPPPRSWPARVGSPRSAESPLTRQALQPTQSYFGAPAFSASMACFSTDCAVLAAAEATSTCRIAARALRERRPGARALHLLHVHGELDRVRGGLGAKVVHAGLDPSCQPWKCMEDSLEAEASTMWMFRDCDWSMYFPRSAAMSSTTLCLISQPSCRAPSDQTASPNPARCRCARSAACACPPSTGHAGSSRGGGAY
ncbi:unnamed protein product [Prorocentrum cordatum]|uniref:Uncharacterized protein n=1 Tax=Prorocentrum cordatum TaxID=2364126 RepID=A0ABN9PUL2_9DINO|nr:unnamed protein product [Polarella glacialis]